MKVALRQKSGLFPYMNTMQFDFSDWGAFFLLHATPDEGFSRPAMVPGNTSRRTARPAVSRRTKGLCFLK